MAQATNFAIGTTVQQSPVKHLGVNLSIQTYYDSGQMLRNLLYRNPGFEGETWQSVLECVAVTTIALVEEAEGVASETTQLPPSRGSWP